MIGKKLSPVLQEIESKLWEFECLSPDKPDYTPEGFRAATKIFMSVLMDKMWDLQEKEDISFEDRIKMAEAAGNRLNEFIKSFTDIDTFKIYERTK